MALFFFVLSLYKDYLRRRASQRAADAAIDAEVCALYKLGARQNQSMWRGMHMSVANLEASLKELKGISPGRLLRRRAVLKDVGCRIFAMSMAVDEYIMWLSERDCFPVNFSVRSFLSPQRYDTIKQVFQEVKAAQLENVNLKSLPTAHTPLTSMAPATSAAGVAATVPATSEAAQHFAMSPSASVSSLPATRSSEAPSARGPQEFMATAQQVGGDSWSVVSAPAGLRPVQCVLPEARVLGADGVVAVKDLRPGSKVRALKPSDVGRDAVLGLATVSAVRFSMCRDSDFVEVVLDHFQGATMLVTAAHHLLVHVENHGWDHVLASELDAKRHQLIIENQGDDILEVVPVCSIRKFVDSKEVAEIELEQQADALFLELSDDHFAALFGSPGWPRTYEVRTKNTFLDVPGFSAAAPSSQSDPTDSRVQNPGPLYRTIVRAHDAHCKAWCKYHFSAEGCRNRVCLMCHSPEHEAEAKQQTKHRGTRR